jgi:hypothetical protein
MRGLRSNCVSHLCVLYEFSFLMLKKGGLRSHVCTSPHTHTNLGHPSSSTHSYVRAEPPRHGAPPTRHCMACAFMPADAILHSHRHPPTRHCMACAWVPCHPTSPSQGRAISWRSVPTTTRLHAGNTHSLPTSLRRHAVTQGRSGRAIAHPTRHCMACTCLPCYSTSPLGRPCNLPGVCTNRNETARR